MKVTYMLYCVYLFISEQIMVKIFASKRSTKVAMEARHESKFFEMTGGERNHISRQLNFSQQNLFLLWKAFLNLILYICSNVGRHRITFESIEGVQLRIMVRQCNGTKSFCDKLLLAQSTFYSSVLSISSYVMMDYLRSERVYHEVLKLLPSSKLRHICNNIFIQYLTTDLLFRWFSNSHRFDQSDPHHSSPTTSTLSPLLA